MIAQWVITKDHLAGVMDDNNETGTRSHGTMTPEQIKNDGQMFRMLDDDGIVYYTGQCTHENGEEMFAPLDDFGGPNAGCTSIEYRENGEWSVL